MKKIHEQRMLRFLVFLAALTTFAFGMYATVIGIYALSSTSGWMSTSFGDKHAKQVSIGSSVLGLVTVLLSIIGCVGALKRKKPCFCCFGLLVLLLLTLCAGGLSVVSELSRSLDQWDQQGYRLYAEAGDGGNLTSDSEATLHTLYVELGSLYAFCAPNATGVSSAIAALDQRTAPPADSLSCLQADSGGFEAWVNRECLASTRFTSDTLEEIARCRADMAAAHATGRFEAQVGASVGDTAWLFCTCGRPLRQTLDDEWIGVSYIVLGSLTGYTALVVCMLCCACQGAAKAKKRKKKREIEMIILQQSAEAAADDD